MNNFADPFLINHNLFDFLHLKLLHAYLSRFVSNFSCDNMYLLTCQFAKKSPHKYIIIELLLSKKDKLLATLQKDQHSYNFSHYTITVIDQPH